MPIAENNSQLYVKSFFAASIPDAMEQARQELGVDALLLNSREAPEEARHLGDYEVVFGAWPRHEAEPEPAPLPRVPAVPVARPVDDPGVARALAREGVDQELARDIELAARKRLQRRPVRDINRPYLGTDHEPQSWLAAAVAEIGTRFEVLPEIGRITALVGPPGSGKTTTLVKLAVSQCLKVGRPVRLISTDTMRIGGAEQLRTYATILGVPFQAVESVMALAQAIDSAPASTCLLIDTPGFSAAMQQELGAPLAQFLSRRQEIDTHLVLTASTMRSGLRALTERFEPFGAGKLLFTRLDEISSLAAIFSEAVCAHKPLSFFAHGQSVPEDLEPASKDQVIDSLVHQLPDTLLAVA
jgi:flagellar biosynthesis protein FlhF